jgi:hypothetical protein
MVCNLIQGTKENIPPIVEGMNRPFPRDGVFPLPFLFFMIKFKIIKIRSRISGIELRGWSLCPKGAYRNDGRQGIEEGR